ncbi:MAG: creatininase family protein [Deltaproteobacteria bacterium]|nr:creatininase family protein [Deltaproteobacteria bacterium]
MRESLLKMTQPEAEAILKRSGLVILPMGSVEQHGPHLPCGTDYLASLAIGKKVAEKVDGLLLPFCPIGVTPFHMSFAGTLSLKPQTFIAVVEDICESVVRHGAKKIVFLNWHEGNTSAMNLAAVSVQQRHPARVLVVQACYIAHELFGKECGLTHGGEIEVLPILAYDSSLVHLERATNPSPPERARRIDSLRRGRAAYPFLKDIRELAPTGWYGEPGKATPEKAREFLDKVAQASASYILETFKELDGNG